MTVYLFRLALEEGDVSVFLDSEEEEPRVASSLLHLPTYIKVNIFWPFSENFKIELFAHSPLPYSLTFYPFVLTAEHMLIFG